MYKLVALVFWFCFSSLVNAHDIGVTEVILRELPSNQYLMVVENPDNEGFLAQTALPDHCEHSDKFFNEGNTRVFRFSCQEPGLNPKDELVIYWQTEAILIKAEWHNGEHKSSLFLREGEVIRIPLAQLSSQSLGFVTTGKRYLVLGFEHILEGIDHLLFVLGMLLLVSSKMTLLKAITAFTLGHSLTLVLSFLDVIHLPSTPVEACIAFSIAILAWEVILSSRGEGRLSSRFPWIVAAGFGLIHGLGFAGALKDLGVPQGDVFSALLFFNIGVELGQLFFIFCVLVLSAGAFYFMKGIRVEANRYFGNMKVPFTYVLGSVAMYWTLERGVGVFIS